jgi:hypothetical protein
VCQIASYNLTKCSRIRTSSNLHSIIQQRIDTFESKTQFFLSIHDFQIPSPVINSSCHILRQAIFSTNKHTILTTWHQYQPAEFLLLACLPPTQIPLPHTHILATPVRWRSGTVNYKEGICGVTGSKHWILYCSKSRTDENPVVII